MKAPGEMLMAALLAFASALSGCRRDMADQPRFKPLAANPFFADGTADAASASAYARARRTARRHSLLCRAKWTARSPRSFPRQ